MRDTPPPLPAHWAFLPSPAGSETEPLCEALGVSPLLGELLVRRGVGSVAAAERFLTPSLEHLHDPFLLMGMAQACERIAAAIEGGEHVVVSGDYDVDGITSSAVLGHFLQAAGCRGVSTFIPNRFDHGYGLTPRSVDALMALAPRLVVTVDNGIASAREVGALHAAGIDTVVTDHHLPPPQGVPPGIVVNPRQPGCPYPFKGISGCGVALKLITALRKTLRDRGWWHGERPEPNLRQYLDLVAIGTVADVVPLVDENRVFVHAGLEVINRGPVRPGIAALMAVSRVRPPVTARRIAFQLAPRINAAGRMHEGKVGVELLLATDPGVAGQLAEQLDQENRNRRTKEDEMLREAVETIRASGVEDPAALVVASPGFHEGIIGIVASRLVEKFHCPVVVLAENEDAYKGSARSVPTVNVTEAFVACSDLLEQFGGHAGAAGCKLAKDKLEPFRAAFTEACRALGSETAGAVTYLDGWLGAEPMALQLAEQMQRLEPFGHGNEEPTFLMAGTALPATPQVMAERHLKWRLDGGAEMVAWNQAGKIGPTEGLNFRVKVGINDYRGNRTVQLIVEEICPTPGGEPD